MSAPLSISSRRNCRPYLWSYVERISGIKRERERGGERERERKIERERDTKNCEIEKVRKLE
jgi:hypothetical protein